MLILTTTDCDCSLQGEHNRINPSVWKHLCICLSESLHTPHTENPCKCFWDSSVNAAVHSNKQAACFWLSMCLSQLYTHWYWHSKIIVFDSAPGCATCWYAKLQLLDQTKKSSLLLLTLRGQRKRHTFSVYELHGQFGSRKFRILWCFFGGVWTPSDLGSRSAFLKQEVNFPSVLQLRHLDQDLLNLCLHLNTHQFISLQETASVPVLNPDKSIYTLHCFQRNYAGSI